VAQRQQLGQILVVTAGHQLSRLRLAPMLQPHEAEVAGRHSRRRDPVVHPPLDSLVAVVVHGQRHGQVGPQVRAALVSKVETHEETAQMRNGKPVVVAVVLEALVAPAHRRLAVPEVLALARRWLGSLQPMAVVAAAVNECRPPVQVAPEPAAVETAASIRQVLLALPTAVVAVVVLVTQPAATKLVVQADLELLLFVTCCQPCRHQTLQQHPTTVRHQPTTSHRTQHWHSLDLLR
jgi:hypothetical protein